VNKRLVTVALAGLLLVGAFILTLQRGNEVNEPEVEVSTELQLPELNDADYAWIASRIFQNETGGQTRYLTHWGEGEDFPSFGIGHFIWFPGGVDAPFDETFPAMAAFVMQQGSGNSQAPGWLQELQPFDAPWDSKQQFDAAWSSARMTGLREWLQASGQLQAKFIVSTFEQRWKNLALPPEQKQRMTGLLQKMAATAEGLFAIIDYFNFKGLGTNPRERYQQQGWGLVQVLQEMAQLNKGSGDCEDIVGQFSQAASNRLSLRVELSPPERNENRWLDGWMKRVQAYQVNASTTVSFTGPGFRIRPYLQNPDSHAVTLTWFSNEKRAGQVLVWGAGADRAGDSTGSDSSPVRADALAYHPAEALRIAGCPNPAVPWLHEVRIDGLEAGTTYHYRVEQDNERAEGVFKTPANDGSPLRFIVYADSETEPESTGKHAPWPGTDLSTISRKYHRACAGKPRLFRWAGCSWQIWHGRF